MSRIQMEMLMEFGVLSAARLLGQPLLQWPGVVGMIGQSPDGTGMKDTDTSAPGT